MATDRTSLKGCAAIAQTIYAFSVGYVLAMSILGSLLMQYSDPLEKFATARFGP